MNCDTIISMKAENNKYLIDVVPLTKIPMSSHQSFSYLSDVEIPSGTLVSIPLFHRSVEGIALSTKNDFERLGNIELKKVEKIIAENFLSDSQIELAKFISDYYISPLGVVMKGFVPKRMKSRKAPSPVLRTSSSEGRGENIVLTKEQKDAVKKIANYKLPITNYLLFGPAGSGKTEVYINSIIELRKINKNYQFLILLPEKTLTPQAMERYGAYFSSEEIVVLSSNISKGQFYSNWEKIQSGEAKIILGTRMAVFAPFKKLGLIVIDEEQDMSFKQWDMNPRYDARTVAEKLAEIHQAKIVRGSATPSIESYFRTLKNDLKLLLLPTLKLKESKLQITNYKQLLLI